MKKLTHIILVFVFAMVCSLALPNKVMAADNTPGTAYDIQEHEILAIQYSGGDNTKWFRFTAPDTGTYEFEALNPGIYPEGSTEIYVYDFAYADYDDVISRFGHVIDNECIAYADCEEGRNYHFKVYNPPWHSHTMYVRVKKHKHIWDEDWYGFTSPVKFHVCDKCDYYVDWVLTGNSYTYDGKRICPEASPTSGSLLFYIPDLEYNVTYPTVSRSVGRYIIKISFVLPDEYKTRSVTRAFRINPRGTYITKLNRLNRGFTVRWARQSRKMATSRITGYKIRYSRNSSMSNAKTVTAKGYKNTYKKITKLSKNKTYYVQVRTYKVVKGRTFYSKWSKKKAIRTR